MVPRAASALLLAAALQVPGWTPSAEAFFLPPNFGPNIPTRAVAVGDSITAGVLGDADNTIAAQPYPLVLQNLLAARYPGFVVLNEGRGGETTAGGLARLADVLRADRPGFVLLMEGTNDATFGTDPDTIVANLRAMVRLTKASFAIPILGTIVPNFRDDPDAQSIIAAVNAQLPSVAAAEGARFVDTFSPMDHPALFGQFDILHPTQEGYDVLGAAWQAALSDAIDASGALLGGAMVAGARLGGPPGTPHVVAGFGPGGPPHVRLFGTENVAFGATLVPYVEGFLGGVRVAACDLDGAPDGLDEIVTGAGPGGGPHVTVVKLDASGSPIATLASFFAFDGGFTGGVFVACGDLDGSGPLIVVGAGRGGAPHVRAFRLNGAVPGGVVDAGVSFFAYDAGFTGGVHVAVGKLGGDPGGHAEIITGAGAGGGPHVRTFRLDMTAPGGVVESSIGFFAYDPGFTGGVFVAADDLDGDGRAELITGAGPGGGPHVRILRRGADARFTELTGFFAYAPEFHGGVFVGTAGPQVLTGAGPGGGPHVRGFTIAGVPTAVSFFAY
jgi:lysophospholipase L1-like esterase